MVLILLVIVTIKQRKLVVKKWNEVISKQSAARGHLNEGSETRHVTADRYYFSGSNMWYNTQNGVLIRDGLHCTRVVIAHRLSTIRHCDRIIVLDGGKIVEDGTYDELMEKNGYFSDLVKRQQVG